jgi:hypothetical protein
LAISLAYARFMSFAPLVERRAFFSVSSGVHTLKIFFFRENAKLASQDLLRRPDVGGMGQCGGSTAAVVSVSLVSSHVVCRK